MKDTIIIITENVRAMFNSLRFKNDFINTKLSLNL